MAMSLPRAPGQPAGPEPQIGRLGLAGGGWIRHARWEPATPARATVLLLQGRSEFLEKYQEQAADWCRRGFRVLAFDWRGQGGSSRFLAAADRGHVADYRIWLDDLARFEQAVLAPARTGPCLLFGHSMGGHLALRRLQQGAHGYAALVLSAPMLSLRLGLPAGLVHGLAVTAAALGWGGAYAPGQGDPRPDGADRFAGNVLTSDPQRFRRVYQLAAAQPGLMLGGVTYGWLAATFRSLAALWAPGALERVNVPVLMLSAPADRVVGGRDHPLACARLPVAVLKTYAAAAHELMMERDEIREAVWADIDVFLAQRLGIVAPVPGIRREARAGMPAGLADAGDQGRA